MKKKVVQRTVAARPIKQERESTAVFVPLEKIAIICLDCDHTGLVDEALGRLNAKFRCVACGSLQ